MPGRGRPRGPKRKRNWNTDYPSFPGESSLNIRKAGPRTVGTASSLSEEWLRCGEGFLDTSGTLSLTAERKTTLGKHLESSPRPQKEAAISKSTSVLKDTTWILGESDLSEDKTFLESQKDTGHGSQIDKFCSRNILCPEDGTNEDQLHLIDWETDSEKEDAGDFSNDSEDSESVVDISDCVSCASSPSLTSEERLAELPKTNSAEIFEYSSDSEKEDNSENALVLASESSHRCHVDLGSDERRVMERLKDPGVKSTESASCTLQKFPRTPEKSARRKLLRGGLAERINGLQNRERSAISLWRHQCASYQPTLSGRKPGVLIVRILELHEEGGMHVAMCEQVAGPQEHSPAQGRPTRTGLKVLFTKETAGHLQGRPQDVIHIFPPWQKLIIPNESYPVILNTYFCKKFVAKERSKTQEVHCWDIPLPRRTITLARMFRVNSSENQAVCSDVNTVGTEGTDRPRQHHAARQPYPAPAPLTDSLLDAVENQGAAPWHRVGVRVVVQRVYCLPFKCQQGGSSAAPPSSDSSRLRVCLLVQDACGMFSEVYAEGPHLNDRQLEGKCCKLTGVRVLQKATRERAAGLFSLIDTLWPPVVPGPACGKVESHLSAPSFCYILSAHPNPGQIALIEEDSISKLYQPPVIRCLREILQTGDLGTRCSFYARVIYQRSQLNRSLPLEQKEIWLMVTDVTLQMQDGNDTRLPRTLPVCVTSSCVLNPEVQEALAETTSKIFLFRDALQDQGRIVCVERTVLLLPEPLPGRAAGAGSWELTGPMRLDGLDSATQVNSVCSVQGTVAGVDEPTACSWPVCSWCGSGRLEESPGSSGAFSCGSCGRRLTAPLLKRHLQVFLHCPSCPQATVKVKLLQSSISSLLQSAVCEEGTYEVNSVLGKEVGLLNCFVQSRTTHPASCIGLEEIELLGADRASLE
ncbi:DNA repair-scaffolding protein [Sorex araneus]|uniref:DNA repair-scaffolding protein n=1 Tax=Sorex araneus TaxID=42254 RepID=UPI0024337B4D|nr:DNA repair-scaffolding protein [Sorex araneus]